METTYGRSDRHDESHCFKQQTTSFYGLQADKAVKDVRAQKFQRTDFFKTLTAGRK